LVTLTPANATSHIRTYGGIETKSISELEGGIALGFFGPGGIGKTTLAGTIVDSEFGSPALYLNARGNPHVISSKADRIQVLDIWKFAEQEKIRVDMLKDKDCPFKTVILDNVSEMFYMDLRDRYGADADVDWTKHSATTADVLQMVRNWVDMTTGPLKLNVVFVFQEVPEAREIRGQKVTRSELAFNKALQFQIPTIITFLGRLYIVQDREPYTRLLDFRPIEALHQAKFQIDPNDERTKDIPMEWYNPSLASLLDSLKGGKPWPTEKHARPKGV
jgi:GTPase SAR1 family protein